MRHEVACPPERPGPSRPASTGFSLNAAGAARIAIAGTADFLAAEHAAASNPTAKLILGALIRQRGGDMAGAERLLMRAARDARAYDDRAPALELLGTLYLSTGRFELADEAISDLGDLGGAERRAAAGALRSWCAAARGDLRSSRTWSERSRAALVDVDDTVRIAITTLHLGLAAYARGEHYSARDQGLQAARIAEDAGAPRLAALACSLPYAIAHGEMADADLARHLAEKQTMLADEAGDQGMVTHGLASQITLAAETGDAARLESLRRRIVQRGRAEHIREGFVVGFALTFPFGWRGEWEAFAAAVGTLREMAPGRQERALCDAFLALASAALGDVSNVRTRWKAAVHTSGHEHATAVHEGRNRRIARAIALVAARMIGDVARAERVAVTLVGSVESALLSDAANMPSLLVGYSRLVDAARSARADDVDVPALTPTHLEILRLMQTGDSFPDLAANDPKGRKASTFQWHSKEIQRRLGARNRHEAVLIARKLGLL